MSIVILQEEIVHYEALGRGRPLIFLHGWVGSWRYWITSMQAASISFRAYALDMWGFGDSAKQSGLYSLEQQVNLLDQFLQEMGIGKIALIGHGLGAVVGLMYAQRNPKWVDRVMVVGLPSGSNHINNRLFSPSPAELVDWLLGRGPDSEPVRSEASKADARAVISSIEELRQYDTQRIFRSLPTPLLMVHGQNDPVANGFLPGEGIDTLPEHIHQIMFEGSGHFPMIDEANKFNRLVTDFLSLTSGTSPRQLQLKEEWKRRVR